MSDDESSSGELEESVMYQCRKCPGKLFTLAERDVHRQSHKENIEGTSSAKKKPGPFSRTRTNVPPPPMSNASLFEPVQTPESNRSGTPTLQRGEREKRLRDKEERKAKIRSKKRIKTGVVPRKNEGG